MLFLRMISLHLPHLPNSLAGKGHLFSFILMPVITCLKICHNCHFRQIRQICLIHQLIGGRFYASLSCAYSLLANLAEVSFLPHFFAIFAVAFLSGHISQKVHILM